MKNDLTVFEKNLIKAINTLNNTSFNHNNFMEWSNDEQYIKNNLKAGENMYAASGYFVAIKEK